MYSYLLVTNVTFLKCYLTNVRAARALDDDDVVTGSVPSVRSRASHPE